MDELTLARTDMMRAVVFSAPGQVAMADIPAPAPGPGQALLRVRASGICHTDVAILHGDYGDGAFPLVPGHEFAGEVEAVGPGVTGIAPGDRVAVDPNLPCGTCRACRRGRGNLCATLGAYGVSVNGGFAERCVVAADKLVPIGDLPFHIAALAEPMACVLNGLDAAAADDAEEALIFGAGPIGVLMAMALRARGVGGVTLADIDPARLEMAAALGFGAEASGSDALAARTGGMDLVVDATGVRAVVAEMLGYAASGGAALVFGVASPSARIEVSPFELFRRQLRLAGAHSLNANIPEALATIRAIGPDIERIVSHRIPLGDVPAHLRGAGGRGTLKVQAEM